MRATREIEARAPGRANLIGEHTDYNGGFVLPCAIGYETTARGQRRRDRRVVVRSRGDEAIFDLDELPTKRSGNWTDYVRGVLAELEAAGLALPGADLEVVGTLPIGAGLSSSASFEAAIAMALLGIAGTPVEETRLAWILQRAEIEYAGTRCGIMDQFTVLHARAGSALSLDTRSMQHTFVDVPASLAIVICNSMVKHQLAAAGAYNERRHQCEESVARLRTRYPEVRELRDVSLDELTSARNLLPPPLFERSLHVVTENARVLDAVAALNARDFSRLGAVMKASHESLRTKYAVSCPELDTLVRLAAELPGVYGARMTGAGFGGCTVNIVERDHAEQFREGIAAAYRRETGIVPEIYDGTPVDGASVTLG
jgi:galactokinase